jgi:hypothetical protein
MVPKPGMLSSPQDFGLAPPCTVDYRRSLVPRVRAQSRLRNGLASGRQGAGRFGNSARPATRFPRTCLSGWGVGPGPWGRGKRPFAAGPRTCTSVLDRLGAPAYRLMTEIRKRPRDRRGLFSCWCSPPRRRSVGRGPGDQAPGPRRGVSAPVDPGGWRRIAVLRVRGSVRPVSCDLAKKEKPLVPLYAPRPGRTGEA